MFGKLVLVVWRSRWGAATVVGAAACAAALLVTAGARAQASGITGTFSGRSNDGGVVTTWNGSVTYGKLLYSSSSETTYNVTSASASWTVSGTDEGGCSWSGSGQLRIVDGKLAGYDVESTASLFSDGEYSVSLLTASQLPITGFDMWPVTRWCPGESPSAARYPITDWLDMLHATSPLKINGGVMSGSDSFNNPPSFWRSWSWNLRFGTEPLKADPGGPYKVLRGGTVQLDGSHSTPGDKITSYKWTFTPGADCPRGTRLKANALKQGMRPTVAVLCSLQVKLTVSDGHDVDSASTTITTLARKLDEVPFRQDRKDKVQMPFEFGLMRAFGLNRSAQLWKASHKNVDAPDRWLDPGPDPDGSLHSVVFKKLVDPHGPFDGFWYVVGHNLKIDRVIVVNEKLLRGGEVYDLNRAPADRAALSEIVAATRRHERIHGDLVQKSLADAPLLPKLEKSFASGKATLLRNTNLIIGDAETRFKNASSEQKVHTRMRAIYGGTTVTVIVPHAGDTDKGEPFTLADLGDL